jgi:tetratricopeptide (TPR) repeat protein
MDALRYDEALDAYARAYAVNHDPALLYNQGRALQALGRHPEALSDIERFAREAPADLRAKVPRLDELIAELRAHVARLTIQCPVNGARVLVRDHVIGTTPLSGPVDMEAGRASLEIDAEGYEPYKRELDLAGGSATQIDAELAARATSAVLHVASTAASALVVVDGQPVGNAPVETVVQPGTHEIALHREGFEDVTSTVVVEAGQRKEVTLEPQHEPLLTQRWWFWAGVGAVVVGGVVITYAALKEKPASQGDSFAPSQVAAPLVKF